MGVLNAQYNAMMRSSSENKLNGTVTGYVRFTDNGIYAIWMFYS